jgi:NMD protein affecting ribosome stability and mRNA decay
VVRSAQNKSVTHIRRNIQQYGDPYLPQRGMGEKAICKECGAVYHRRHWSLDKAVQEQAASEPKMRMVICPACRKIKESYFEGEVTLLPSPFLSRHKKEILRTIVKEETRAKGINPLARIVGIAERDGVIVITTTNEKLAQRVGRLLKSTYQGTTTYHWSGETRCLRVRWKRL